MTTFSTNDLIFSTLSGNSSVDRTALQNLAKAINQNAYVNDILSIVASRGDVVFEIATTAELAANGAGAFFSNDRGTAAFANRGNKFAIKLDPSWFISQGKNEAMFASTRATLAVDVSPLGMIAHEADHSNKQALLDEASALRSKSPTDFKPLLTGLARAKAAIDLAMRVEISGWYSDLRTMHAEVEAGRMDASRFRIFTELSDGTAGRLLKIENAGKALGLSGAQLEAYVLDNGQKAIPTSYVRRFIEEYTPSNVSKDEVRKELSSLLANPVAILDEQTIVDPYGTTQIVSFNDGTTTAVVENDSIVAVYDQDSSGGWMPSYWTQGGQIFTGGDLDAFITSVQSASNVGDNNSAASSMSARLSQQLASASGDNVAGAVAARDSGATLDTLANRLGMPYVSDRWAPSFLNGQISSQLLLLNSAGALITQGLAQIAQLLINSLRNQPSIFTVRVLGSGGALPLVLDLDDDGLDLVSIDRSNALFDANATGTSQIVGWVGPRDGILVLDKNGNGIVDDAGEWFGQKFATSGTPPANQDGFRALATLANAGATTLAAATSRINAATGMRYFDELQVWIDADQNGKTDTGELRSLASLGITSIDLNPQGVNRTAEGNTILSQAGYSTADGKSHTVSDVGLATELPVYVGGTLPVSPAALAFAEYAGKGYAAMAAGQGRAIAAAVQGIPAGEQAAIDALRSKFGLPASEGPFSPAALEIRAKMTWAVQAGLPQTSLNDKLTYFIGPANGDRTAIPAEWRRINTAPADIIDVLSSIGAVRSGETATANAIATAGSILGDAEIKAQVANATQSANARSLALASAANAASAWNSAIVGYLDIKARLDDMAARLPAIQAKLNEVVPQNLNLAGHLPNGATFLTRADASMAAEAFRAYSAILQPLAALKVTGDQLLSAIGQSNGYTQVYVGQNAQTITAGNGYNLLLGGSGYQTFVLGAGVDNIAVTSATGDITVSGFQVGSNGDRIQSLSGGPGSLEIGRDGNGNTIVIRDGKRVTLLGVDPSSLDLFANLSGVTGVSFATAGSGVRSLQGMEVYDGQTHITTVVASYQGDTLIGGDRASQLIGNLGNDTFVVTGRDYQIVGGGGVDTVSYAQIGVGVELSMTSYWEYYDEQQTHVTVGNDNLGNSLKDVVNIVGSNFNDVLVLTSDFANVLNGGKGNDVLGGGYNHDTYVFALGDGKDLIEEMPSLSGGSDTVSFAQGVLSSDVKVTRAGEDLVLSYGADDSVTLKRWYSANSQSIEQVRFADGTIWDAAKLNSLVNAPIVQHPLAAQNATEDAVWTFVLPADTFAAQGGATLSFSAMLADGTALPSWLRFDAVSRTFTGTPVNADVGNLALKVIATDPAGGNISTALIVNIANTNDAPTVGAPAVAQEVAGGIQWTYTLPADLFKDVDVGDQLAYSVTLSDGSALPSWLSFDASTRTFSGKAGSGDVGLLDLKVIAADLAGASASQSVKVTVTAPVVGQTIVGTAGNDTLTGTSGNDLLNGVGGNDSLNGGDGNDHLDGGTGADAMNGGAGNDTYVVDNVGDTITELTGGGRDTVIAGIAVDLATLGSGQIEDAVLSGTANLNLTGNALDNVLTGNAGKNTLRGGAGNDTLIGGQGGDILIGDGGVDTYVITAQNIFVGESATTGDTVSYADLGQGVQVQWAERPLYWDDGVPIMEHLTIDNLGSSIYGVFNFMGTRFNDQISGNDEANVLNGGAGDDSLNGGANKDTLIGGTGNDILVGGTGSDIYQVGRGDGADTVQENDATAGNTDVLSFGPGIEASQLWLSRTSNDLEIGIIGTSDKVSIQNWYSGSQYRVEQIKTSDGKVLLESQVQNLVQAMASFAPPAAGQTILPANLQASLASVLAANWH